MVVTGSRRKMKNSNKHNPAVDLIREVVAHREENRPQHNPYLLQFPVNASDVPVTSTLAKKPSVEASAGVGHIFNFFRVDVVRQFSCLEHTGVSGMGKGGRFKVDF